MKSLKRTIWKQFSQGTKIKHRTFLKVRWPNQSNQNILDQNNSSDHGFLLGGGGGGGLTLLYGICKLHQTQSKERVWWSLETKSFHGIVWVCVSKVQKKKYINLYTCCLVFILQSRPTFLVLFEKFYCLAFKTSKIFIFSLNIMCIK